MSRASDSPQESISSQSQITLEKQDSVLGKSDHSSKSGSAKEKDLYMLAAAHLKEGHISRIEERPESEDAVSVRQSNVTLSNPA